MLWVWGVLVYSIILGVVTDIVIKNKGYEESWFLWGFFFGVFALIVACTKPSKVAVAGVAQTPAVDSSIPQVIGLEKDYDTLYTIPERQYSIGSPVVIKEGKLLKEKETGRIFAKCGFQIVTSKKLKGAFVSVLEYDVAGDFLEKTDTQYLDLDKISGYLFGSDLTIELSHHFTRKIEVQCTKVIFEDDTRWDAEGDWYQIPESAPLSQSLVLELENQYKQEVNEKACFYPLELEKLWVCSCGSANNHSNSNCLRCKANKENVFASLNAEELRRKVEERKAEERKAEERKLEKRKAREQELKKCIQWFKGKVSKKQKIMIISALLVVVLMFVFAVSGTGRGVKAQLCDGVWCWQTNGGTDKGLMVSTRIYEFKPDNTFTVYAGIYYSNHSMDSRPMTEYYSGKYHIDEERSRINLTSSKGQTVTYPFVISKFTHELIFQDVLGESTFWKEKSLQDGLSWYDKVH